MVPVGQIEVPARSNQKSLDADVTDIVRRWVANPSENNGLALKAELGQTVILATAELVVILYVWFRLGNGLAATLLCTVAWMGLVALAYWVQSRLWEHSDHLP
jgi:hypothetical protein